MGSSALQVLQAPPFEPASRAEAKRWMVIDAADTTHDQVVDLLIKGMRELAETITGRAFVRRQYRLTMDDWPLDCEWGAKIVLPRPPLISVDSVKYRDMDGTLTTLAADQYEVHAEYEPGFVVPVYNVTWPSMRRRPDSLQVTYWAGYAPGSPDDEVGHQEVQPSALKLWMEARAATLFENREQLIVGGIVQPLPRNHADALLDGLVISMF